MLKKLLVATVLSAFLVGCSEKKAENSITVATIDGPETQLVETAKKIAAQRFGLNVKIVTFSDYDIPNVALNDGSVDANAFQHLPFLQEQIKARGYQIAAIGKTFLYPVGLYSKKIKNLSDLKDQAKVAIPNDPSNEARALLLLQTAGLIKLKKGNNLNATVIDIAENPKHLKIVELDAAELPRALGDVALAAINTNFAIPAGLSPAKDALFLEDVHSPYVNIIAVRKADLNNPNLLNFVKAFQSDEVAREAKILFGDGAIPGWSKKSPS